MEKKALGKGLAALLPESEAKETGQTIHMIPVTANSAEPVSAQKNVCRRRAPGIGGIHQAARDSSARPCAAKK